MSAFSNEVDRLVEGQWVAQSAVKSLEAFHKAAIAKAEVNARKGQYHDDLVVVEDFIRFLKKMPLPGGSMLTAQTILDNLKRAWEADHET